jgi:Fe-Mn family superoxide dismutase
MSVYVLPELSYSYSALEPVLSAKLLELHHSKHHAAYVAGANKTLEQLDEARSAGDFATINQLSKNLAFNLSGHVLHSRFWENMGPDRGGRPEGELAAAIDESFGSFEHLQAQLTAATMGVQGSGWGAVAWEPVAGRLVVEQIYDHQSNVGQGTDPLLVIDAWEHAYYLDYLNDRAAWVKAFWNVVDWPAVADRFSTSRTTSTV